MRYVIWLLLGAMGIFTLVKAFAQRDPLSFAITGGVCLALAGWMVMAFGDMLAAGIYVLSAAVYMTGSWLATKIAKEEQEEVRGGEHERL